jgi:hypothetical protein
MIWLMIVFAPCPNSEVPHIKTTLPSASTCTVDVDASGAPGSVVPKPTPRPWPFLRDWTVPTQFIRDQLETFSQIGVEGPIFRSQLFTLRDKIFEP